MAPQKSKKQLPKKLIISLALFGIILIAAASFKLNQPSGKNIRSTNASSSASASSAANASGFNKTKYSTTDASSPWVVVNKQHALIPKNFVPPDLTTPSVPLRVPGNESMQLRSETVAALEAMFAAAKSNNLNLMLSSGYRSFDYQVGLYNGYVRDEGQAAADKTSARPGHSEHQTGLAADIEPLSRNCELMACFANTPEGVWLANNAYKYGFILRYQPDKVAITGYDFEPWHFRFVGKELAAEMHAKNITTLEEFFDITGGNSYR